MKSHHAYFLIWSVLEVAASVHRAGTGQPSVLHGIACFVFFVAGLWALIHRNSK